MVLMILTKEQVFYPSQSKGKTAMRFAVNWMKNMR
jgi:hypothetical protein